MLVVPQTDLSSVGFVFQTFPFRTNGFLAVLSEDPGESALDQFLVHKGSVFQPDESNRPSVTTGGDFLNMDDLAKNHAGQKLLRSRAKWLAFLRGVDAVEPDLYLGLLFEDGDRVPIRDSDHLSCPTIGSGKARGEA